AVGERAVKQGNLNGVQPGEGEVAGDNDLVVGFDRAGGIIGQIEPVGDAPILGQAVGDDKCAWRTDAVAWDDGAAALSGQAGAQTPGATGAAAAEDGHGALDEGAIDEEGAVADGGVA